MIVQLDCDHTDKVITHSVAETLMGSVSNNFVNNNRMLASEFIICIFKDDYAVLVEDVVK